MPFEQRGGSRTLSLQSAMRALVALAALAACLAHARPQTARDAPHLDLPSHLGNKDSIHRLITCSKTLGPAKCLTAMSAWRAKKAVESFDRGSNYTDVDQFPWEDYNNTTNEQIYSQLCEGTEKLLQYRKLSFTMIPGYRLELQSKENGKINVDVYKNEITEARGTMKKLRKQFYSIVPLLLIPGLIMAAVLPFMLPAMKMATVASIMLNNMALTGAVFTLLRDNAFNDYHRPKVKYINAGWKNEEELYHGHETQGHSDREEYYISNNGEYDHDTEDSVKVEEYLNNPQLQHSSFPKNWLNRHKDQVELNIQYDPHKRRG